MSNTHRNLVVLGLAVALGMGVYPPWKFTRVDGPQVVRERPAGYSLIWDPPKAYRRGLPDPAVLDPYLAAMSSLAPDPNSMPRVDFARLLLQMFVVGLGTAMVCLAARPRTAPDDLTDDGDFELAEEDQP